jgi:hypothetical protein
MSGMRLRLVDGLQPDGRHTQTHGGAGRESKKLDPHR